MSDRALKYGLVFVGAALISGIGVVVFYETLATLDGPAAGVIRSFATLPVLLVLIGLAIIRFRLINE